MASINAALEQVKLDPLKFISPSVAESVCEELDLKWRDTPLTPPNTIALLARQVMAGNVSNQELVRLAKLDVTPEAYCMAKGRVPLNAVVEMSRRTCEAAQRRVDADDKAYCWKGHRTWHVDGSSFSMPDTPELQQHFGQPGNQKPGCGFPVAHILCLFGARSGLIREVVVSPLRTGDLADTPTIHPHLCPGDLVIADSAFGSYFHLAALKTRDVFGVFPNHQKRIVNFRTNRKHIPPGGSRKNATGYPSSRWIQKLGKDDQIVEYFKPLSPAKWMTQEEFDAMPASIRVREIRRTIRRKGFRPQTLVVVTTLLDPVLYPADEIVELLDQRWDVETNLRHLKTTMGMEVVRCKSVQGVQKELWAFAWVYNLVRIIMMEGALRQKVPLDRISFADALYWIRYANPCDDLPNLIINPLRPDRIEPRAIKRRPKEYDRLNKPRAVMRKALKIEGNQLF